MNILFVTTNNYPNNGTCSNIINNILFTGKMINTENSFSVLASKNSIEDNDYEECNSVNVYRAFSWTLVDRNNFKKTMKHHPSIKGVICRGAFHIQNNYVPSLFIDYTTSNAFYDALKRIDAKRFDLIITIAGRYDACCAVMKYCSTNNVRYLLYQVDPCATNKVYSKESLNKRREIEISLYEKASYIITTPLIMHEHTEDSFKKYIDKMQSVEFPVLIPKVIHHPVNNKKRVMFLGSFYKNVRSPEYMFRLFDDLLVNNQIFMDLVGVSSEILNEGQKKLPIKCHGRKSIEECKKMMQEADVLINIGNRIDNQVPSKIFEYISSGKPIVNICAMNNCPTIKYLEKYPLVLNIVEDETNIHEQKIELKKFIFSTFENLTEEWITKTFIECTPEFVATEIMNVINMV